VGTGDGEKGRKGRESPNIDSKEEWLTTSISAGREKDRDLKKLIGV